jgi:isoleucyl-tRNA synthetase
MDTLFHALVRWLAPVLVFTTEEAWEQRFPGRHSVHLETWPEVDAGWRDQALCTRWEAIRAMRAAVTEAIEPLRRDKTIRSSLEAEVVVPASAVPEGVSDAALAELFITATVTRGQGDSVIVTKTHHHKCGRCWRLLPDVAEDGALCGRCDGAVGQMDAAA